MSWLWRSKVVSKVDEPSELPVVDEEVINARAKQLLEILSFEDPAYAGVDFRQKLHDEVTYYLECSKQKSDYITVDAFIETGARQLISRYSDKTWADVLNNFSGELYPTVKENVFAEIKASIVRNSASSQL